MPTYDNVYTLRRPSFYAPEDALPVYGTNYPVMNYTHIGSLKILNWNSRTHSRISIPSFKDKGFIFILTYC